MFQLPKIYSRKLEDLDNLEENPFRVIKQNEKLLVYHEKQREIQRLENSKRKIELKYLRGDEHIIHLSSNRDKERRGFIREINNIPASDKFEGGIDKIKGPFHARANSVQPSRNNEVIPRTTEGKWLNETSNDSLMKSSRRSPNALVPFRDQSSP